LFFWLEWYILDNYNKIIIINPIEEMENIERLNSTLEKINNTLERLTIILDNKEKEYKGYSKGLTSIENKIKSINNPIPSINQENNSGNLHRYNPDGLQSLLRHNLDDWSNKFVTGILESTYDTVTDKQLNKLIEIGSKVNYKGSLVY
jgi:hypothetical protein